MFTLILNIVWPPVKEGHVNFVKNHRFVEKIFLRESGPLADFTSTTEFVGEEYKFKWSNVFKSFGSQGMKTAQVINLAGTLRGRKIEAVISIGLTPAGAPFITNVDYFARLPKKISGEVGIDKKFLKGYIFTSADAQLSERLNQSSDLRKSVNGAIGHTYKDVNTRISITPAFALAPEGEGNTVIWLRTTLRSIWWTLWLVKELRVQQFYNVVEAVDRVL